MHRHALALTLFGVFASVATRAHARETEHVPQTASDPGRAAAVAFTAVLYPIGGIGFAALYFDRVEAARDECLGEQEVIGTAQYGGMTFEVRDRAYAQDACRKTGALGPLFLYGTFMAFAPGLPRIVVGNYSGMFAWAAATSASIGLGWAAQARSKDNSSAMGYVGVFVPFVLGIIELSTTPRRDDLLARSRPKIEPALLPTQHGLTLHLGGAF